MAEKKGQNVGMSARAWSLRDALADHWGVNQRKAIERALEEAAEREGLKEREQEGKKQKAPKKQTLPKKTIPRKIPQGIPNPLREIRLALKMTQDVMAARIGCTKMTVRYCEYKACLPQNEAVGERLRALAKEAGVELPQ